MKKFITLISTISIMLSLTPIAFASSTSGTLTGSTNDLDYVYTDSEDNIVSRTGQAESSDNDAVQVYGDLGNDDQYLYMGMTNLQFDKIMFKVTTAAKYDQVRGMEWEYNDGSSWEELEVSGGVNSFTETGLQTLAFDIPSDWDQASWNSKSAYWVRVSPRSDVNKSPWIDQIAVRAYNVKVTVEDEDGDDVTSLVSSDFDLSDGSDNSIYAFKNMGSGVYEFAIQGESSDRNYEMTIDDSNYDEKSFNVGTVANTLLSYSVELDGDSDDEDEDEDDYDYDVYVASDCDTPFKDISGSWARTEIEDLYCRGVVEGESYYYYEPNDEVTRAEFLKMALLNAGIDTDDYEDEREYYDDVRSSDWFYDYVVAGRELGVIENEEDFRPYDSVNRAEAVTMLVRLAEIDTNGSYVPLSDVSSTAWYAPYVRAAYYDGVVEGYSDGTFKPSNEITRGEAAVMMSNAYDAWM